MASYNNGCKWKPRKVSAKRDFPEAFYHVTNESLGNQLSNKCESVGLDDGSADKRVLDFIHLETKTECLPSESCGSSFDIIPRIVNTERHGSDEGIGKLGAYTEVKIHGVGFKEIRWYETEDGLKIELSVDKLEKMRVDDESFGRVCEGVTDRVTNERVKRYQEICSRRRPVSAIRKYPPGCGPVMKKTYVDLQKNHIVDKSFGRSCGSITDRLTIERVKRYQEICSRRRPVSAIRKYPPGCGPVMKKTSDRVTSERVKRYKEICYRRRPVSAVRKYPPRCGPVMKKTCVDL
ncbi:hypothetical protein Hanom_Chr13g01219901 [Helianthus anomalus]